jgi:hypothetical protein
MSSTPSAPWIRTSETILRCRRITGETYLVTQLRNSRLVRQRPWRTMAASGHSPFKAVGLPEVPRIFVPHPIQDATDEEIRDKTDVIIDRVIAALTN